MEKHELLKIVGEKLDEAVEGMSKKRRAAFYVNVIRIQKKGINDIDLIIKIAKESVKGIK